MVQFRIAAGALVVAAIGAFAATGATSDEVCIAAVPDAAGQNVGYELIDFMRREAWVTRDWTLQDYAAFTPGPAAFNWSKNNPRQGDAAQTSVMRSPDCDNDGEFTYRAMFDRSFFHIANIVSIGPRHGTNAEIREAGVLKYHRLEFDAGQIVSILRSPDDNLFIRVNRPVGVPQQRASLPAGWSVTEVTLHDQWRADLFGRVRVLRLQDGASYQGPIEMPGAFMATD